ncbi:MAG: hypothetical protein KGH65_01690 [Candidatus Micrarchaeota archaeon]|nr:hypothetical protein [Candidatus Micrarchaeota archaeon]
MPRFNNVFGYKKEPIQGNDDIGLWTNGQRVRKDSEVVKKHAEEAFSDIKAKLTGVGSALSIINDERASRFSNLMGSPELNSRMAAAEEIMLGTVKDITGQILDVLENPNARRPYGSGPTGVLELLRQTTSPTYDFVCPVRLPDQIANLVDVSHEAEQYRNKEKRLMSGEFGEFAKHEIGSMATRPYGLKLRANTATEQILALERAAGKLSEKELVDYLVEYNSNAIIALIFLEARKKGTMDGLREFLNGINDVEAIRKYSPYRTYEAAEAKKRSKGSGTLGAAPANIVSPPGGAGAGEVAAKSKVVAHFNEEKEKLLAKLKEISSKTEKEKISVVNHDSVALIRGINSMLDVLSKEEKEAMDLIVEQIHASFSNRAERIGLKVNYINNVGKHDFGKQDADDAFAEWKEDMREWQKSGNIRYSHQNGNAYTNTDLDKFLEERKQEFLRLFNGRKGLYNLRRGKGYDADVMEGDENNSAPVM